MPQPRVQSLERALDLLEALAGADELGVSEIAAQTGLVPSTAHRLLGTLVARGYASQNPTTGRYLLGYKMLELTSGVQDRLGAAAHRGAAAPGGDPGRDRRDDQPGRARGPRRRLHRVGLRDAQRAAAHRGRPLDPRAHVRRGKALLAWRDPADVATLLDGAPLAPSTPRTLTTLTELQDDLTKIRRRGYAPTTRSTSSASPAWRRRCSTAAGRAIAAISVSGPISRILNPETPDLAGLLREHAEAVSAGLLLRTTTGGPEAARLKFTE